MPNYSNGKIYKIVDNTTGKIYIGSTTQPLAKRLAEHKRHYHQVKNKTRLNKTTSSAIFENGDYDIVLIEECNCETKEQLHRIEREYIESLECVNRCIPLRTKQEYQQDNRERLIAYLKQYYQKNKEEMYKKNNQKVPCECGFIGSHSNMNRHKKSIRHAEAMNEKAVSLL